jgi:CDP-glucose 4,6-dehydratase
LEGVVMDLNFWSGRRVLITGHTGFKGSWLSLWLTQLGAEVTGFALQPSTTPSLYELLGLSKSIDSIIADITNPRLIEAALVKAKPEIVFHMAAQPLVRQSYLDPYNTYLTNVMGTVNVLQSLRAVNTVRSFVNITTDKCYENNEWLWGYRESEPLGGFDPYSSSKACSELITAAFRNSYFNTQLHSTHKLGIATARAGNVIGGGDWAADRLMPDILNSFGAERPVVLRNPNSIRPWQHVLEPLRGYLTLAHRLFISGANMSEAWNFGPADSEAQTVEWVVDKMAKLWGQGACWEIDSSNQPHEANFLKLDISKAKHRLDWSPKINLDETLMMIVEWEKARLQGNNMRNVTIAQIKNYEEMIEN